MSRRKKAKRKQIIENCIVLENALRNGTRVQKIDAMALFGVKISKKSDSKRVDRKIVDAACVAGEIVDKMKKQKSKRNRRKSLRKKRN